MAASVSCAMSAVKMCKEEENTNFCGITYAAKAGDRVFGTRGIPHAFAMTNGGNARLLMTFQPAGKMQECFIAMSEGRMVKMTPQAGAG